MTSLVDLAARSRAAAPTDRKANSARDMLALLDGTRWPCNPLLVTTLRALVVQVAEGRPITEDGRHDALSLTDRIVGAFNDPAHPDRLLSGPELATAAREAFLGEKQETSHGG